MKTSNFTCYKKRGAALIEIMIVLSILAILLNIALQEFKPFLANNRLENRITLIQRALRIARSNAETSNSVITFCALVKNQCDREYWHKELTVFVDNGDIGVFDERDTVIFRLEAINKQDMLTYPRNSVNFRPDGTAGFNTGTFVYCPEYKKASLEGLALTVSQPGRVRLKDTDRCQQ
ncbi:hypothetical protein NCCP2140_11470 [Pseudoalteromonas sp. NCCP-2140]|uniref:GspH/FimT family pseudopilin n=1 Tax=Pseudoalteromonas sp. NCCP-2140 TaxID=2942288 RepID=UPI0020410B97|nr:GspH/FimT family pseudopilin [Pseudoalteromonas sp. NCCP-2140]GKW52094.1 hypothetical protein NCCP2140_11470 [Pseudoalteromonas sp. NCCP-2140]